MSGSAALEPAGFFVLRTPLLPFDTLTRLSENLEAPSALDDPARLADAWSRDRARLRERLQALLETPAVREAIFVASPDLDRAIERWLTDPANARSEATERAVVRYVSRMASRATPFGLFAGSGVGAPGETTHLAVSARAACRRHTRLDMDYLVALADALARDPALAPMVRYTPNSSLYRLGDRWRLVETRMQGKQRSQHLVAVDDTTALASTIERAREGASRAALAAALVDEGIAADEADAFVGELIDSQILVGDIECPVTGAEPLTHLVHLLRRAPEGEPAARELGQVAAALESLDGGGLGVEPDRYRGIAHRLESFPVRVDLARLFQVDLLRPAAGATLDRALVDEIIRGADTLRRLTPRGDDDPLGRFRAAFAARYEQRETTLVEALDEESGIGDALVEGLHRDASPLLRGLDFPAAPIATRSWSARETHLLYRVGKTLVAGQHEMALTPGDIDEMTSGDVPPLPDACALMATLIEAPSRGAANGSARVLLHHVGGPSGANLLGRFCHGDPDLHANVAEHLRDEEALDPDALFAEVVHLPEGRLGNVLLRPVLRRAEVPYLGRSGSPSDQQIPVTDLTLRLVDGRFVLRSRRLGRRIVPRLTNAHNFTGLALNIYRLLGLLQSEGRLAGCTWDWGALAALPFLPRVTCGRLVFARATWRLTREDIRPLKEAARGVAQYAAVQHWRRARRLPRWVVLTDQDNTLPVDLDNALAVDSLIHLLKERESATLTELYPGEEELCAEGDDGRYMHELLIPCVLRAESVLAAPALSGRRAAARSTPLFAGPSAGPAAAWAAEHTAMAPTDQSSSTPIQRTFAPGSEWVYARLYAGASNADRLLSHLIGPVSQTLLSRGWIDRWFFIRYADPDQHLRWRLHVAGRTRASSVQRCLERAITKALASGLVRRLVFDTYEREVERYGGDAGVDAAERYFWIDSEAIVQLLDPTKGMGPDPRWQAAISGVDTLLSDFGFDLDARLRLMQTLRARFGREFHADAPFARRLAARYRAVRPDLRRLLSPDAAAASTPWLTAFARRSARAREALTTLHAAERAASLDVPVAVLAESYVHMHLNRLFRAEQRPHELVVYDFLSCWYEGRLAQRHTS
jgi:thiopeptide-type bacteriocin biosynthesis protein